MAELALAFMAEALEQLQVLSIKSVDNTIPL